MMQPAQKLIGIAVLSLWAGAAVLADSDTVGTVEQLPAVPGKHWLWVDDAVLNFMIAGRASLIDGDSGRFLGMVNTGYSFTQLTLPADHSWIYSAETYYSRYTRGKRTDVVTVYDPRSLSPVAEVVIPPKRGATIPMLHSAILTDDERFMAVFNITPGSSVTIVDVERRAVVGEIETPGCSLLYPAGERRFFMLCTDGSALTVELDEQGEQLAKVRTKPFFDPHTDPISERAVRLCDTWLFASFDGDVYSVDVSGEQLAFGAKWPLVTDAERSDAWRMGGFQHLAAHQASGLLYSIMHQGGKHSRKDPGKQVWVYDVANRRKVQEIIMRNTTGLIELTQDEEPLLFSAFTAVNSVDVYDARTGNYLRTIADLGYTPSGLQAPWRPVANNDAAATKREAEQ